MDAQHGDSRVDRSRWVWVPQVSYGPFVFGSHISETPFLGGKYKESDMGSGEMMTSYYSSLGQDIEICFWDSILVSVTMLDVFVIGKTNLIGCKFDDVQLLISQENRKMIEQGELWRVDYDDLDCMVFVDAEKNVLSIDVGIDPDIGT